MYNVSFYQDKNGNEPVKDYILKLAGKQEKDSRIKLNKIQEYIQILAKYGTQAGEPYIKHIEDGIWELRPIKDRILFVSWEHDSYILLHHFVKKTQKTPKRELHKAKRNRRDLIERGKAYEK